MKNIKILFLIIILTSSGILPNYANESKIVKLANIEASHLVTLLPENLQSKVKPINEQNGILIVGSLDDIKSIEDIIKQIDIPIKQLELEVRVIELNRNALRDSRFLRSGGFLIGQISNGLSLFDFSKDTWNLFNSQVSYLERYGYAHIHAYPKIVSISGRTASININTNNNLVLGNGTGVNGGDPLNGLTIGVAQTQRLDSIKAGTNLAITPIIGKDDLITSKIIVEISDNSGLITQNNVTLPSITTRREINTNVQIMDGQTLAIGGLIFNNKNVSRQGLPFITQIPILGDLLSNRGMQKNQTELLILITPKIKNSLETINLKDIQPDYIKNKYFIDDEDAKLPWFKRIFRKAKKNVI